MTFCYVDKIKLVTFDITVDPIDKFSPLLLQGIIILSIDTCVFKNGILKETITDDYDL